MDKVFEEICVQIVALQKENQHITPTVNDIYDVLASKFSRFRTTTQIQYKCIRDTIVKFNKLILEKKMNLKEAVVNIVYSIVEECKVFS